MRWSRALVVLSLAALAIPGAHCSIYDPSLLVPSPSAQPSADAAPDPCTHARWPDRPTESSVGGSEYTVALSALGFLGQADAGAAPLGFDLDGTCTCPGPPSCAPRVATHAACDDVGGVDNGTRKLLAAFSSYPGFWDEPFVNAQIGSGTFGALFRVRNYNGLADDSSVELAFFPSGGTEGVQGGKPSVPKWDGQDRWTLDPDGLLGGSVLDGGAPIPREAVDPNAYVRGGVLVASMGVPLRVPTVGGVAAVELTGSVIVAKLVREGSGFRLTDGVVAGRWPSRALLPALAVVVDPFDKSRFLCGDDPVYQGIRTYVCRELDVTSNVKNDGKNETCSALSVAFRFEAKPALAGSAYRRAVPGPPCGAAWADDCPPP